MSPATQLGHSTQAKFTTDAISCQPGSTNAFVSVKDSIFLDAAPIEINCDQVNTFHGERTEVRAINVNSTQATAAVQIGATVQSYDFDWTNSSCDQDAPGATGNPPGGTTEACLNLVRLEGASITGSYFEISEYGTGPDQLAIRLSSALTSAVHIAGNRFSGDSNALYAIETNGATGVIIEANEFDDFGPTGCSPNCGAVDFLTNVRDTILRANVKSGGIKGSSYNFSDTSGSIGGTALSAGNCSSGNVTIAGATPGMPVSVSTSDGSFLGGAFNLQASVTSANTVTVNVCAVVAGTPPAKTYVVNVN